VIAKTPTFVYNVLTNLSFNNPVRISMKRSFVLYISTIVMLLIAGCDNSETTIGQPVAQTADGLGASSTALVLLVGSDGSLR
jgi:hypothetical protein